MTGYGVAFPRFYIFLLFLSFSFFGNFLVPNDFSQFSHFPTFLFLSFWNFSGTQWLAFPGFHFLCFTFPTEDKVLLSSQKWNLHICFSAQENILQNLIIFRIIYKKIWLFSGSQNTSKASTGRSWTTARMVQPAETYHISFHFQNICLSTVLIIFHW